MLFIRAMIHLFPTVKDGMFYSAWLRLVEQNIPSVFS